MPVEATCKTRTRTRAQDHTIRSRRYRGFGVQRLEVLIAVMLARQRPAPAGSGAPLAAALASLSSGALWMIADAVAALGVPCEVGASAWYSQPGCEALPSAQTIAGSSHRTPEVYVVSSDSDDGFEDDWDPPGDTETADTSKRRGADS